MTIETAEHWRIRDRSEPTNVRSVAFGAGIGNALEWYDFASYAIFAPFFSHQFFSSSDRTAALLSTLAIFAVGFLLRPLGGLYFGWLADRKGRRHAMVVSMAVKALGCLVIGLAPTYESIGILAPILLVVGRLSQGFGLGGEIGASFTFLVESAPSHRRGLWSSTMYCAYHGLPVSHYCRADTERRSAGRSHGNLRMAHSFPFRGLAGCLRNFSEEGLEGTGSFQGFREG